MNLVAVAPAWLLGLLVFALAVAGIEDAGRLRISNLTSFFIFALALGAGAISGFSIPIWQNAVVFVAVLVLGTAAFSAGLLGGGDVKLFAATGFWFNFRLVLPFLAIVLLAGGAIAIVYLLARPFRKGPTNGRDSVKIPYGIAIAIGAIAIVLMEQRPW